MSFRPTCCNTKSRARTAARVPPFESYRREEFGSEVGEPVNVVFLLQMTYEDLQNFHKADSLQVTM